MSTGRRRPWKITSAGGRCHGTFTYEKAAVRRAQSLASTTRTPMWVHFRDGDEGAAWSTVKVIRWDS